MYKLIKLDSSGSQKKRWFLKNLSSTIIRLKIFSQLESRDTFSPFVHHGQTFLHRFDFFEVDFSHFRFSRATRGKRLNCHTRNNKINWNNKNNSNGDNEEHDDDINDGFILQQQQQQQRNNRNKNINILSLIRSWMLSNF